MEYDFSNRLMPISVVEDDGTSSVYHQTIRSPEEMYADLISSIEYNNKVLESEGYELINTDSINKEKVLYFFKTVLEKMIEYEQYRETDIKTYLEKRETLKGFSVYLFDLKK
jgi:hypothetical protein